MFVFLIMLFIRMRYLYGTAQYNMWHVTATCYLCASVKADRLTYVHAWHQYPAQFIVRMILMVLSNDLYIVHALDVWMHRDRCVMSITNFFNYAIYHNRSLHRFIVPTHGRISLHTLCVLLHICIENRILSIYLQVLYRHTGMHTCYAHIQIKSSSNSFK